VSFDAVCFPPLFFSLNPHPRFARSLINVAATSHFGGCAVIDTLPGHGGSVFSPVEHTRFIPDCVLIRDNCRNVHGEDHTHQLLGLMYGQVPCINEAKAVLAALDKPVVYAALLDLRNQSGTDKEGLHRFPLVEQEYFANEAPYSIQPKFPLVAKINSARAGFGKMRARDQETFVDLAGVVAVNSDYYTTEGLIEDAIVELCIQKLGDQVRAYRRKQSADFRTWHDQSDDDSEDIPVTTKYKQWASAVALLLGGLEVFTLNVLQTADGREHIIGLHDTACPLAPHHQQDDKKQLIKMVVEKVKKQPKRGGR
jgi:hypothetical protein